MVLLCATVYLPWLYTAKPGGFWLTPQTSMAYTSIGRKSTLVKRLKHGLLQAAQIYAVQRQKDASIWISPYRYVFLPWHGVDIVGCLHQALMKSIYYDPAPAHGAGS